MPSRERETAKVTDSAGEMILSSSTSAVSFVFDMPCSSFEIPSKNRIEKHTAIVSQSGKYGRTMDPAQRDTPRIELHIRLMTPLDSSGILTRSIP